MNTEQLLNLAQAEIRAMYKRLDIKNSNVLDLIDKALDDARNPPNPAITHLQAQKGERVNTTEFIEGNYWVKYAGEWKVAYCIPKSWTNGYWLFHGIKPYYHTSDFEEIGERIERQPAPPLAPENEAESFAEFIIDNFKRSGLHYICYKLFLNGIDVYKLYTIYELYTLYKKQK